MFDAGIHTLGQFVYSLPGILISVALGIFFALSLLLCWAISDNNRRRYFEKHGQGASTARITELSTQLEQAQKENDRLRKALDEAIKKESRAINWLDRASRSLAGFYDSSE